MIDTEEGMKPGIYCNTNIYPAEWQQSQMLRQAYGTIYAAGLAERGLIPDGHLAELTVSPYFLGQEGYALLLARILAKSST